MSSAVGGRPSGVSRPVTQTWVVLARGGVDVARWPLGTGRHPDLAVVDELARLHLAARRLGLSTRLRDPCGRLCELLDLAGLAAVVTVDGEGAELVVEVGREPEGGEEVSVEEGMEPGDPVA
jgi:hypothetical protein